MEESGKERIDRVFATRVMQVEAGTVLLLPVRIGTDGRGQYRDDQLTIPKELRHFGVPADFLQPPDERTGLSEYGAAEAVVYFTVGVAQNMVWDVAKQAAEYLVAKASILASSDDPELNVSVKRISFRDGTTIEDLNIKGPASTAAADIVRALTGQQEPPD